MGRIESYLGLYQDKATIRAYRMGLKSYFNFIYGEGGDLEEKADRYIAEGRDCEDDLANYQKHLGDKKLKIVSMYLAVVRSFLVENGVLIGDGTNDQTWLGLWIEPKAKRS